MARVFLALREIRRAKARFTLLTGAIGLLVFLILFQQTILGDLVTQFIGAIRNQSAQVLVYGDQARRNVEGSQITPDQQAQVLEVDGVAEAGPIGEGTFTVTAGGEQRDAVIFGYRLGGPGEPTTLTAGRLPEAGGEAVAADGATAEGFAIGDQVTVEPGGDTITIVGIGRDLNYSVTPTLFVDFATYESARRTRNPDAQDVYPSLIGVQPEPGVSASELAQRITDEVDGVEALTRQQAVDESPGVSAVQQSFGVILLLAYIVVTLITGFFFLIITTQKARALTLLRAVGAPSGYLVRSLLVQVVLVMVAGIAAGWLLLELASVGVGTGISLNAEPSLVIGTGVVLLVLAVLASLGAVRRVLRIDPIEATTGAGVGA
ncbi:MAG: peptide ABC transporter permease [Acidimicrobiales bacterium]|nr:peptide ABC transporter permease [Acidimicrobiales bacterium]